MPKILVADDSIAVRKVAERLLTEAGLGVTLVANGEEALAFLSKDRPDVIVSDVIMPDKSGYEICAFVRGNSRLASTPVLLISGIVNDEVTKQAEACRADGILKKPFQGTSLKDRVLELLARRQPQTPAPGPAATPAQPAGYAHVADQGLRIASEGPGTDGQTAMKLNEVEEQLRTERTRSQQLAKRMAELEGEAGQSKETKALLEAERQRTDNLEAALEAERAAAAQLAQQLTDLQRKAHVAETAVAAEQMKVSELREKVAAAEAVTQRKGELEVLLAAEQHKRAESERRLAEVGAGAMKAQELEVLLATERERNGLLARRVAEAELATQSATKRFEDMARKLGEIAGLASQLGHGKGQS
ncbi:MAG: response regulator [Nitrospiraceae bacterium]